MYFVWALALAGLFCIYLDFFFRGALFAIGGGLFLIGSASLFYIEKPNLLLLALYLITLAIAVYILVRFALWRIRS